MDNLADSPHKVREALCRAFPSARAFEIFKAQDLKVSPQAMECFFRMAEEAGLSASKPWQTLAIREEAFLNFITREAENGFNHPSPPPGLTFSGFLNILYEETPARSATSLVAKLNEVAKSLSMLPVQESMVSRLKGNFVLNTPKKRNFIRLLCYWMGYVAPEVAPWDYHTFEGLPAAKEEPLTEEQEGVRISFCMSDRKKVAWVRQELAQCLNYLQFHHLDERKISHFERIVSFDIPKQMGPSREPKLYAKAMGEALALAHQIVVRWLLTNFTSPESHVVAYISAGNFDIMESNIPFMQLPGPSGGAAIWTSDFARLCARMAEAKVVFDQSPERMELDSQKLSSWAIQGFWPAYFDYVPMLFDEDMIPQQEKHYSAFRDAMFLGIQSKAFVHKSVTAISQFPQNPFVVLEVFKILLHRRMFLEANEALSTLLAADPTNIIARSMRMVACFNLGFKHAHEPSVSDMYFDRAIKEGDYVQARCAIDDEEFFGELGRVYLGRAQRDLVNHRKGIHHPGISHARIVADLEKAVECFERGGCTSPTGKGTQSMFWRIHIKSLMEIVAANPEIMNPGTPLQDDLGAYIKNAFELFVFQGWIDPDDEMYLFKCVQANVEAFDNSTQLRAIIPYAQYSLGTFLHDIIPVLTVGTLKAIVAYLHEGERAARKADASLGIYSIGSCLTLIQSRESFVECAIRGREAIMEKYAEVLENAPDDQVIPFEDRLGLRLCLINLEHELNFHILYGQGEESK